MTFLKRWLFYFRTFRDYRNRLNRCVEVENVLLSVAVGKREALTREECKKLAMKLGVPNDKDSKSVPPKRNHFRSTGPAGH